MILYADGAALELWLDETLDDDPMPMLRKASLMVGRACRNDCYDTLPNGLPSDDDLSEAMSDAVCAQIEMWIGAGINPVAGAGGQEQRLTTSSVDGGSVSFDTYLTAPSRAASIDTLCDVAADILRAAGLASAAV